MQMVMTTLSHNTYLRVPSQLGSLDRHKAKLPHILHLIDSGGIYGIERMLLALLPELQVLGYTVALGCFGMPDMQSGAVGQAATELGIETLFFNFRSGASLTGVARVMQAIARSRQTILHFHGYKATIIGGIAAQLFRRIGVATYHGEASQAVGLRRQIAVESPIIRQLTAVVAVSEPIADELRHRGVAPERIYSIPNGIPDPHMVRDTNPDLFTLAIVGRLIYEKNIHVLLQSVASLRSTWPRLRLVVAGEGPYRLELERRVRELNLTEIVTFLGFVPDVPQLLTQVNAFVMASQTEGMPIALLEAMAVGVPIVATAVGSIPTVTRDAADALLVPPNDPDALTAAIDSLLRDPNAAEARATNARERFLEFFTSKAMGSAYASVYSRIIAERNPGRMIRRSA